MAAELQPERDGMTVVVVAPVGQDARLITKALASVAIESSVAGTIGEALEMILEHRIGVLLMTEEILNAGNIARLREILDQQPPWSDLPILILTAGGRATVALRQRERDRLPLGNVTLLERPIRIATMISSVQASLTARARQYQNREALVERERAEAALRVSESRLRLAIETAHLGSWEVDLESGELRASPQCRAHFDFAAEGTLNYLDVLERIHPDDREMVSARLTQAVNDGTPYAAEYRVLWRDGSEHWINACGRRISETSRAGNVAGEANRIAGVTLDITSRRLSEDALRKSEKLALVGRLASSIAHEINNPLESVTNLLYLLMHSDLGGTEQSYVRTAQEELARVSEIVSQTLSFGRQGSVEGRVVLAEILDSVLALFQGRLATSGIEVERRYRFRGSALCSPGEVRQVFTNLLGNAFDATRKGGRILVRERQATDVRDGRPGIRITVADTGTGIPASVQERLFEAFQSTKGNNGTGLGLWISKGIVEKHRGTMRFRSSTNAEHHGSVFVVFMPTGEA